jgi:hypothetical protein
MRQEKILLSQAARPTAGTGFQQGGAQAFWSPNEVKKW